MEVAGQARECSVAWENRGLRQHHGQKDPPRARLETERALEGLTMLQPVGQVRCVEVGVAQHYSAQYSEPV